MVMKQTILIIIILLLLLPPQKGQSVDWDELEPYAYAGLLTSLPSDQEEAPEPPEPVTECPCNGTKVVSYDGGTSKVPCPCENCKCPRGTGDTADPVSEKPSAFGGKTPRVIMATEPSYCAPCVQFERVVVNSNLKKKAYQDQGWTVGEGDDNALQILEFSKNRDKFKAWGLEDQVRSVPKFFRVSADGTYEVRNGYMDLYEFITFYKKGNKRATYKDLGSTSSTLNGVEWPSKSNLITHLRTNHKNLVGDTILEALTAQELKRMHDDVESNVFGEVIWTSRN
jgi:hypothetical protein